jgi:predicted MFS family arabinose efflux permease
MFADQAWTPTRLPLTMLSVAFILGRAGFGQPPDRIEGTKVALVCMLIEAAGQVLIWSAHSSFVALLGTALTGLGFSLVYPALGLEAIRRAPEQSCGLAMGLTQHSWTCLSESLARRLDSISHEQLNHYLDEFTFRFNHR